MKPCPAWTVVEPDGTEHPLPCDFVLGLLAGMYL